MVTEIPEDLTVGGRIAKTREAARRLGFVDDNGKPKPSAFLQLTRQEGFPRPVTEAKHHKWWDMKAIEIWLNKRGDVKPEEKDWNAIVKERIAILRSEQAQK